MAKYWRSSLKGRPVARASLSRRCRTEAATFVTFRCFTGGPRCRGASPSRRDTRGRSGQQIVRAPPLLLEEELQRFEGRVESEFVPVLEAVGHGLRRPVDADVDAVQRVGLDPFREGPSREPEHRGRGMLQPWRFCPPLEGDVNLVGDLGRRSRGTPGPRQAKHALRHAEGDRDQVGVPRGGRSASRYSPRPSCSSSPASRMA